MTVTVTVTVATAKTCSMQAAGRTRDASANPELEPTPTLGRPLDEAETCNKGNEDRGLMGGYVRRQGVMALMLEI